MSKLAISSCAMLLFLILAVPGAAQQGRGPRWVDGELMIKFRGGPRGAAATQAEQELGHEVRRRFDRVGWQHVRLRPGQTQAEALARLRQRPDVIAAEPNYLFELRMTQAAPIPNDPQFLGQWGLAKIGATNAWALTTDASNVVVAVLDTGVRYTHEDLAANMWRNPGEIDGVAGVDDDGNGYVDDIFGIDAVSQDSDPRDDAVNGFIFHGTSCASIIGAVGNNGRGLSGVNWKVRLMALRLAATSNFISSAWATECFEYVLMMKERGVNVRVTSNSYGLDDSPSGSVRDALEALGNAGVINVFAAGNANRNVDQIPDFPAGFNLPSIINVAATTTDDLLATFSNYGATNVDLAAPGVSISVADGANTNAYNSGFTGTSASCPFVAGSAALLAAAYPSATVAEIKTALMATVDFAPSLTNKMVSHGRLNLGRAMYHAGLSNSAPPHLLVQPLSQTNGVGYATTFSVTDTGARPIAYYWQFGGSEIARTVQPMLTLSGIDLGDAGNYSVILSNAFGKATSTVATLTVVTNPVIWSEPQSIRVLDGTNIALSVGAAGAFPLSYQWQRGETNLPGETNPTLTFINTQGTMTGDYRVRLSNAYGSATTAVARLTVLTRPHFIVQPESYTVAVGANITLRATVTNTATLPIGYQWQRGVIQGPTTVLNQFTTETNLFNIQTNLWGVWSVLATNEGPNAVNFLRSSNAYVTIVVPPTNLTVQPGANATFQAIAVGPSTPTRIRYQWQRNGVSLLNATNANLTVTNAQPADAGNYAVIVTNSIGQPTSFAATLAVIGRPLLTQPKRLPNGSFQALMTGLVINQTYRVEVSTNLIHWEPRPPFSATATTMPLTDTTAAQTRQSFFRVRSGPP